ncbi:restriction endonuclease [Coralloluteibacterium stylophorae]|uniref:Restriction endonuclease n=2 Tax=Coralloluteibacterium stylophorae TaxID=1776034 RepID=A0A8J7VTI9_9GAMM|nr:restriction endonuclease [Coralloluteibacterium stylophorae]MBS7456014.1 restriction endonuclease [Coralloluteibacterium stylophorae]
MARGKQGALDALAAWPWPVGVGAGVVAFVAIRHGIAWWPGQAGGPLGQAMGQQAHAFAPLAWVVLGLCWLAALVSWAKQRHRRRLLETRTGLDSLAAIGWRDFERLVGEAFRRQGYAVEETGLGGADGGIDLILRRDGRRTLVQCKQWRRQQVPVNVVREMFGLLAHHRADAVLIAALGGFTPDAARFAAGKPITLIDGPALLAMVRRVQGEPSAADTAAPLRTEANDDPAAAAAGARHATTPDCPRCGTAMVQRANRATRAPFWGCARYPSCRQTVAADASGFVLSTLPAGEGTP